MISVRLSWNSIVHEKMDKQALGSGSPSPAPVWYQAHWPGGGGNVFNLLQHSTQQTSYTNQKNKELVLQSKGTNLISHGQINCINKNKDILSLNGCDPAANSNSRYNVILKKLSEYAQVNLIFQIDCWMQ